VAADHWFEELAEYMGSAYLRYSFTKNTVSEVDFLVAALGLEPGDRVLDVGCGPGRHSVELARRGIEAVGVDISQPFLDLAATASHEAGVVGLTSFHRVDARQLADATLGGPFDAAVAMCQGAFGLQAGPAAGADPINIAGDQRVLEGMATHLRGGGQVGVAAFSAYFQVQHLDDSSFDALSGTNHEQTEVRDPTGAPKSADLWTTCFTPRELWMLMERAGLTPTGMYSVSSVGDYEPAAPTVDEPEFFGVAVK
jgi:SAM-dependent methyltransferase